MKVQLTVMEGPHQGSVFAFLESDIFVVGRSKDAHFRLPLKDKYFSRNHFMVEVSPPQCCLMDMASTNGTFVNDKKITRITLRDGDTIRGGETVIRVSIETEEPTRGRAWLPRLHLPGRGRMPPLRSRAIRSSVNWGGAAWGSCTWPARGTDLPWP